MGSRGSRIAKLMVVALRGKGMVMSKLMAGKVFGSSSSWKEGAGLE